MPRPWSRGWHGSRPLFHSRGRAAHLRPRDLSPRRPDASFASRPLVSAAQCAARPLDGLERASVSALAMPSRTGTERHPPERAESEVGPCPARYPYDAYSSHGAAPSTQREPPDRAGRYAPHAGLVEASGEGMDSRPSVVSLHPVRVAAESLVTHRGFRHTDETAPSRETGRFQRTGTGPGLKGRGSVPLATQESPDQASDGRSRAWAEAGPTARPRVPLNGDQKRGRSRPQG